METVNFLTQRENLERTLNPDESAQLVTQMENMTSYWDLFSYFHDLRVVKRCLNVPYPKYSKDEDEAKYYLLKAMGMPQTPLEALKNFNKSIRLAPHPKLSFDPDGVEYIEEMNDSPDVFGEKYKVLATNYVYRSSCLLMIKQPHLCIENLELASKCGVSGTEEKIREMKRKYCRKRFSIFGFSPSKSTLRPASQEKVIPVIIEPNSAIPTFSNALGVEYTNSKGSHVIANRDIRSGEVLVVEKGYCSRIYPREQYGICPVCFIRYFNPFPCPTCKLIMFCSIKCRIKGLKDHQRECEINNMIEPLGLFGDLPSSIPLKIVLSTPFTELKEKLPMLQRQSKELPPEKLGFDENGKFNSHDYRAVYHMAGARRRMGSPHSLFSSLIAAYIMTKVLAECNTYFVDSSGEPFDPSPEDRKLVGGAIMHHMWAYPHGFFLADIKVALDQTPGKFEFGTHEYGDGLFPSASFLRHSCIAPTIQYTLGDVTVVRAIFPIASGQEVTVARGDFMSTSLYIRKMQFGSLGIECHCEACEDDWPLLRNLPNKFTFKCLKCKGPLDDTDDDDPVCPVCTINYKKGDGSVEQKALCQEFATMIMNFKVAEKRFTRVLKKMNNRKPLGNKDFRKTCCFAELLYTHVQQPSMVFFRVRIALNLFQAANKLFTLEDNV